MNQSKTEATAVVQDGRSVRKTPNLIGVSEETMNSIEATASLFGDGVGTAKARDVVKKLFELYSPSEIKQLIRTKMTL